ncbi:MAG: hypothetical protein WCA37_05890 [Terracidiphilus sp.]
MLTPISPSVAAAPQATATASAARSAVAAATVSANRASAQDTVSISSAGQQAVHTAGDVDHDGDSH